MRLTDQCELEGCTEPHHFRYGHINIGEPRHNFCSSEHQKEFIRLDKERKRSLRNVAVQGSAISAPP